MTSIRIVNVSKRFGETPVLEDVSLEIAPGELFFLLGPSGCGKTTLLRTIAGFYRPDRGSIFLNERDVTRDAPQRRNTAMVFQSYALWPHMTVEANVAFGLAVRRVPRAERRQRVAQALESVRMSALARRKPNQLSGGQQQRVALARALAVRPACLLLDEPLSNLDAKLRLEMRGEIRRICKESGLTAVYVTHDQHEAMTIADRMAILFHGQLAQVGEPEALYHGPATREVADFLGETNFLDAVLENREATRTVFRSTTGLLQSARSWAGAGSGTVVLSIRPESLRLTTGDSAVNVFVGQILERLFMGESTQLLVRSGDARLRVRLHPHSDGPTPHVGQTIRLTVSPGDIVPLPAG